MNLFACVEKNDAKLLEQELAKVQDKDRVLRGTTATEMSDLFKFCVKKSSVVDVAGMRLSKIVLRSHNCHRFPNCGDAFPSGSRTHHVVLRLC
jgi:hypothetical protein